MRTAVLRIPTTLRRWCSTVARSQIASRDETLLFSDEQIRFLAERGVIYLTEQPDGRYSTIIAHDYTMAGRIAEQRRSGEEIVGLMGEGFLHHLREPEAGAQTDTAGSGVHAQEAYA